ncbi:44860_t:CDS:2 [Gigaspora margarita]|uniref:44860_t:CDS:1 n=1 Tax=Gigaspora margarita TaxID=4874 RepID=A0ABN7WDJ3_GIGMA|nr:44860_t:CDS:2 [Gigaspora margarita]
MSIISLLEIPSVRVNDVIKGPSLNDIKSYFKNFDQTNISEAFDATALEQNKLLQIKNGLHLLKRLQTTKSKEGIQIYSIAMYYIALCYLNDNDECRALGVPQFLEKCNKYSDALKVYELLYSETKVAAIKNEALCKIKELQINK